MSRVQGEWKKKSGLIIIVIVGFFLIGMTYAFYVAEDKSAIFLGGTKAFYFESDILGKPENEVSYIVSNYDIGEELTFHIRNYEDDFRMSEEDITYEISAKKVLQSGEVEDITERIVPKSDHDETGGYQLEEEYPEDVFALVLSEVDFQNQEAEIIVTARSLEPFTSTLEAEFSVFQPFDNAFVTVNENSGEYTASATISSYEYEGEIIVQYTNSIYPDRTNAYIVRSDVDREPLITLGTGEEKSQMTIEMGTFSAFKMTFFKDNSDYEVTTKDILLLIGGSGV